MAKIGRPVKTPNARTVALRLPGGLFERLQAIARERNQRDLSANDLMREAIVAQYGGSIASEAKPVTQ